MRFLIFTQYYPPEVGATQTRLEAVAKALTEAGNEVEIVTAMPNYPEGRIRQEYRGRLWTRSAPGGIQITRVWLYAAMGAGIQRILNYLTFMGTGWLGLLIARRPDYLFVESPPLTLAIPGILVGRWKKSKLVLNVADLWPDSVVDLGIMKEGLPVKAIRRLEAWAYGNADFVTAVTEGIAARIRTNAPGTPVLFLPNGVDTSLFRPHPRSLDMLAPFDVPPDVPVVMYAGTLGYAQSLETLLAAAADLAARGVPLHVVLVGDGSDKDGLVQYASDRRLSNVTFIPAVPLESVARMWAGADIGYAGLRDITLFEAARPSKLLPAMASGKPVVYSGRGEIADLIAGADAGVIVPPDDPIALAEALEQLVSDAQRCKKLGLNGRRYVETHLTWSKLVSDWLAQLEAADHQRVAPPSRRHVD